MHRNILPAQRSHSQYSKESGPFTVDFPSSQLSSPCVVIVVSSHTRSSRSSRHRYRDMLFCIQNTEVHRNEEVVWRSQSSHRRVQGKTGHSSRRQTLWALARLHLVAGNQEDSDHTAITWTVSLRFLMQAQ